MPGLAVRGRRFGRGSFGPYRRCVENRRCGRLRPRSPVLRSAMLEELPMRRRLIVRPVFRQIDVRAHVQLVSLLGGCRAGAVTENLVEYEQFSTTFQAVSA